MKYILTLLVINYSIYGASSSQLKKASIITQTVDLVEQLKKKHNPNDLSALLHHVLDNTEIKTETVIAPKGVRHRYEVTTASAIKQLISHGANKKATNANGLIPHRRFFRIVQGAPTLRLLNPIKVTFMGFHVQVDDQTPQLEVEVPYNSNLDVGGTHIPRALLIGDPFVDAEVKKLLHLLDPES